MNQSQKGRIPVDSGAFEFRPQAGKPPAAAALCVHGLTGTPYEMRLLGEALCARGFIACGPVLPGHLSSPAELARTPHTAWLAAVRSELERLRSEYPHVVMAGLSLGGLLTLAMAAEQLPDAVAVIGTPLRLPAPVRFAVPVAKYLRPMLPKAEGSDIQDPSARAVHPGYATMPLAAVHELIKLQRKVERVLPAISLPIFVAHGALDKTASPADADRIAESVGSECVERMTLRRSGHVVPVDYDGPELAAALADFLAKTIPVPAAC